jgi:hypothetical protein
VTPRQFLGEATDEIEGNVRLSFHRT